MNRRLLIASFVLLAGCGSNTVEMENASAGDVAKEMGKTDVVFVNPGKWQQTASLLEMNVPGMPPQVAEAMKRAVGTSQVHETCLTPEQAKHPKEDFFSGAEKNCRYEHFKWGDGKIDLKAPPRRTAVTRLRCADVVAPGIEQPRERVERQAGVNLQARQVEEVVGRAILAVGQKQAHGFACGIALHRPLSGRVSACSRRRRV